MSAGQGAFSVAADVAALEALELELSAGEVERGALHVAALRRVLRMHALYSASGMGFGAVPHAALAMGCSEHRAARLLAEALALAELPGALEAVECGLLSVEQSTTLVGQLTPVPLEVRLSVWRRLQTRLCEQGVLPPARLNELLRRWVVQADPDGAQQRRRAAEDGRRVEHRRRDDGLHDLFAPGFRAPDMQAILSRIAQRSAPVSVWDDRTADQRRFDALKDLLLGRESLPLNHDCDLHAAGGPARAGDPNRPDGDDRAGCCPERDRAPAGGSARCGCLPGSPVPCGVEVLVHLRWQAAIGMSDEPAELVGHGPLEPDLVGELLLAAPRLRAVWTDEHGVPIAVDDKVLTPTRGDAQSVRQALLELARRPPPPRQPRFPDDHAPPEAPADDRAGGVAVPASAGAGSRRSPAPSPSPAGEMELRPAHSAAPPAAAPSGSHPPDEPGPYRPPRRVRRLMIVRAPRCEWPGCGARAERCDAEHDLVWPLGPTCPCNLGPCCRRHHRVKQTGWTKTRHIDGSLTWTSRTGRGWLSPTQHHPPQPATRALPPVPSPSPFDELSPDQLDEELWSLGLLPDDDHSNSHPPTDRDVPDSDRLGQRLQHGDTRWTLDLDNPYLWLDDVA